MRMDEHLQSLASKQASKQARRCSMEYLTMKKKIGILEHAFAAAVGAYYSINLTKNLVPGSMYQVIGDTEYSLNEQMNLPENARFSDVVK